MAWSDSVRNPHARATIFDDLLFTNRLFNFETSRILGVDVTEETPCIGLKRRVSECVLRVTNDLEPTGNVAFPKAPMMSAGGSEDVGTMAGKVLRVYIWEGDDTGEMWTGTYIIDSIEATDGGATIHGLGVESLLDRTFDEAGLSTTISRQPSMTWMLNAMAACGFNRSSIRYLAGYNGRLPREWTVDGSMTVGEAVMGIAAYRGLVVGVTDTGVRGAILPPISNPYNIGTVPWVTVGTEFPEPELTERYGTLIVKDPTDGTEQEATLDDTLGGRLEISVPFSSLLSVSQDSTDAGKEIYAWNRTHNDPWFSMSLPGDPDAIHANRVSDDNLAVSSITVEAYLQYQDEHYEYYRTYFIDAWQIEHRFDGGFSQRIRGSRSQGIQAVYH